MGIFDKKDKKRKPDDFDSPVERIDLSVPSQPTASPEAQEMPRVETQPSRPAQQSAPVIVVEPEPDPYGPSYGIEKAIQLMRTLPQDNVELVVQVVKHTLESTNIKLPEIIRDAARKQDTIQGRIKVLRSEISEFEKEIGTRQDEISRLDADYKETSLVRDRLELAESMGKKSSAEPAQRRQAKSESPTSTAGTIAARQPAPGARPGASNPSAVPSQSSGQISKPNKVTPGKSSVVLKK